MMLAVALGHSELQHSFVLAALAGKQLPPVVSTVPGLVNPEPAPAPLPEGYPTAPRGPVRHQI